MTSYETHSRQRAANHFILIASWSSFDLGCLKAKVDSVVSLGSLGLFWCTPRSLLHEQGNKYLISDYYEGSAYEIDIGAKTSKRLNVYTGHATGVARRDGVWLLLGYFWGDNLTLVKDGEELYRNLKAKYDDSGPDITTGRWTQEIGHYFYMVTQDDFLVRVDWTKIESRRNMFELIAVKVEDFFVTKDYAFGYLKTDSTLVLPFKKCTGLKVVDVDAKWTLITKASNWWIVSGEKKDNTAILASINPTGIIISKLLLQLTPNEYQKEALKPTKLYCLKTALEKRMKATVIAFERDGCCQLISTSNTGKLFLIQSLPSLVPESVKNTQYQIIYSVSHTDQKGQFLIGCQESFVLVTIKLV